MRVAWTVASIAAHAAAIALLLARPLPERGTIAVVIAREPLDALVPARPPPPRPPPRTPARRASGPARRGAGHRGIPVPRTVPDTLPAPDAEAVVLELDEALPLGGSPFAGEGGVGFGSGGTGRGGVGGLGPGEDADPGPPWLRKDVLRKIQRYVDREPYPRLAELMGWRGTVRVGFVVRVDGSVRDVHVVTSSGHEVLDRAAVEAVKESAPFARPPEDQTVIVPVVWYLPP